jgi:hypothetical protein
MPDHRHGAWIGRQRRARFAQCPQPRLRRLGDLQRLACAQQAVGCVQAQAGECGDVLRAPQMAVQIFYQPRTDKCGEYLRVDKTGNQIELCRRAPPCNASYDGRARSPALECGTAQYRIAPHHPARLQPQIVWLF